MKLKFKFETNDDGKTCTLAYVKGEVGDIVIPSTDRKGRSVTVIGNFALYGCTTLTSVTIPDSVTSIGSGAFRGCTSLTSITIGNSVTFIGDSAFEGCTRLSNITIPDSVTGIDFFTFENCRSLESITIPDSVVWIGWGAFEHCKLQQAPTKYYFKATNAEMQCQGYQYELNKWFKYEWEPELCRKGFHACKKLADVFNYDHYYGEIGKDVRLWLVELGGAVVNEWKGNSQAVANRIKFVKELDRKDVARILSGGEI